MTKFDKIYKTYIEEADTQQKEASGYILMLPYGGDSKSASIRPALISGMGIIIRLRHKDDDSFGNITLRPYHKKYCKINYTTEGDVFIVNNIEELPDPYQPKT